MHLLDVPWPVHISQKPPRKKGGELDLRFHMRKQFFCFQRVGKSSEVRKKGLLCFLIMQGCGAFPVSGMTGETDMKLQAGSGKLKLKDDVPKKIFLQGAFKNRNHIHIDPFLSDSVILPERKTDRLISGSGKQFTFANNKKIETLQRFKVRNGYFTKKGRKGKWETISFYRNNK